jgi:hypothetical protein
MLISNICTLHCHRQSISFHETPHFRRATAHARGQLNQIADSPLFTLWSLLGSHLHVMQQNYNISASICHSGNFMLLTVTICEKVKFDFK